MLMISCFFFRSWDVFILRFVVGGVMDLVYVCEWEKWFKSIYCSLVSLVCVWFCRNFVVFITDFRNDD